MQAVSWPVWIVVGLQLAVTPVTAPDAATVIVVDPVFVVSWVEVAVMVTCCVNGTELAVKTPPAGVIVPKPLAVQVTALLKLPVPETVEVQVLVCPAVIAVGLQLAPTAVIVDVVLLLLPPPHATPIRRQPAAAKVARTRTPSPLLDLADIYALRNHRWDICAAVKVASVSSLAENKS